MKAKPYTKVPGLKFSSTTITDERRDLYGNQDSAEKALGEVKQRLYEALVKHPEKVNIHVTISIEEVPPK